MCAGIEDKDTSVTGEFLLLCGFHFSFYPTTVKLSTVLSFVKRFHPLDFLMMPYPTASTCAIQLTLP